MSLPPEALAYAAQFFEYARQGNVAPFMPALAAGLPPTLVNDKGDSLLMLASYHGHAELTDLLLSYGANPNALNDKGQAPLAGTIFKHELDISRALVRGGADPDHGTPTPRAAVDLFFASDPEQQEAYRALFTDAPGAGKGAEDWDWRAKRAANRPT